MRRLVCIAVLGVLLGACAPDPVPEENGERPYLIVVSGGLSAPGVLADNSETSILAARASVADVNARGGIAGRPVEVIVIDDAGDPTVAVTKLREQIDTAVPDAYLNSGPSTVAAATLPVVAQHRILSFNLGPTADSADPSVYPLNFDLSPSVRDQAAGFVDPMREAGHRRVGIIHGSTAYGQSFGVAARDVLGEHGLEVVGVQEYDTAALDMTAQLEALRARNPDVLVFIGYGAPVGYVLQGRLDLDWPVPVMASMSVASTRIISRPPPEGVLGTPTLDGVTVQVLRSMRYDPANTDLQAAITEMKRHGEILAPMTLAMNWDAVQLIAAAAGEVGDADDPEALARALEDPQLEQPVVVLTRYNFGSDTHAPRANPDDFLPVLPSVVVDGQFR